MKPYYRIVRLLSNFLIGSIWRVRRTGEHNIPSLGGVIIASNHKAYIDPPLLAAASQREFYFLAKKELFGNRVFGWLIKNLNAMPISRGAFDREGLKSAVGILKKGKALVLFPEGKRIRNETFGEPRLGVGKIALEAGVPIVPVYIFGSNFFFRSILKNKRVCVSFGPPIHPEWLKKIPKDKNGYKMVVQEIMERIKSLAFKTKLN